MKIEPWMLDDGESEEEARYIAEEEGRRDKALLALYKAEKALFEDLEEAGLNLP